MAIEIEDFCQSLVADRKPRQEFNQQTRAVIVALSATGQSVRRIARLFSIGPGAVHNIIKTYEKTRNLQSMPRSGRPSIFTPKEKKYAYLLARRNPRATYHELISQLPRHCHNSTIRRILQRFYLKKWRAQKRIPLSKVNRRVRYAAAKDFLQNEYDLKRVGGLKDVPLTGPN